MRSLIFAALLASFVFSFEAKSENIIYGTTTILKENVVCYSDSLGETRWNYCIVITQDSKNTDVLYNFHGLGGSENEWLNKDRNIAIRNHWKKTKQDPPAVVTLSFGRVWLMAEKNASEYSGLYELFRDYIQPKIESKLNDFNGRRLLMGASMGGFNASQIMLKNPEMFDAYVLACPIMSEIELYASEEELLAYQKETNANFMRFITMIGIARRYFPDEESFEKAWQIKLAQTVLSPNSPPFHISCGDFDEYGIHKSVMKFKDIAIERGAPVKWKSLNGGHCVIDPVEIGSFLVVK